VKLAKYILNLISTVISLVYALLFLFNIRPKNVENGGDTVHVENLYTL
jgi:hypothetical protein